jgi:hypothetical protein
MAGYRILRFIARNRNVWILASFGYIESLFLMVLLHPFPNGEAPAVFEILLCFGLLNTIMVVVGSVMQNFVGY